jgi:hypothetical protein
LIPPPIDDDDRPGVVGVCMTEEEDGYRTDEPKSISSRLSRNGFFSLKWGGGSMGESMDDLAALLFRERCFILDGLMTFSCERVADVVMLIVAWIDAPS